MLYRTSISGNSECPLLAIVLRLWQGSELETVRTHVRNAHMVIGDYWSYDQKMAFQNCTYVWHHGNCIAINFATIILFSVLMTYHQLKRSNLIMEYIEKKRIVQGLVDISRVSCQSCHSISYVKPHCYFSV